MYTIKDYIENTIIIKNSKFICCLYKVDNIQQANDYLKDIKNIYKDATHYCYAYIIDNYKKFSDDLEPNGTAGAPIMQVLIKNDLNYVLCIVIRYFGGIKLGASGLIRAYSKSARECLKKGNIISLIKGKNITIEFSYEYISKIDNILKDSYILNKEYSDIVIYNVDVKNDLIEILNTISKVTINKDIYL